MGRIKNFFLNHKKNEKNKLEQIESKDYIDIEVFSSEESDTHITTQSNTEHTIMGDCQQIIETTRTLEELKSEYQAVTAYLTDIQKIERMPEEDRDKVNDIARRILILNKDKAKYQKGIRKINDIQYKQMAKYEEVLPVQLRDMKNQEQYREMIQKDMKYLEREKEDLLLDQEEGHERHEYFKRIAITTCILVVILFLLFIVVNSALKVDMILPFLLTVIMALLATLYIFMSVVKNRKNVKLIELKLNRCILLLNKVKIKYINNTNTLDYSYQKFMVESYEQLKFLWEEYLKAKLDEERYEVSTNQLDLSHRDLIKNLRNVNLSDTKIWIYQANALIDDREMVEVRHRLNVRRQKLRENIDYNNGLRDKSIKDVGAFIEKKPENRSEVVQFLQDYGIEI
ncbi:MAG: hypothetical protein ACK5JH_01480 [Anaerocolumna sp.]